MFNSTRPAPSAVLAAALLATGLFTVSPAAAQGSAQADDTVLIVAKRLGETVYCQQKGDAPINLGKDCMNRSSWRRRGVTIDLPARSDGTVLAHGLSASGSAGDD